MTRLAVKAGRALLGALLLAGCSAGGATTPGTTSPAPSAGSTPAAAQACMRGGSPPPSAGGPLSPSVSASLQAILDERVGDRPTEPSVSAAVLVPGHEPRHARRSWADACGAT